MKTRWSAGRKSELDLDATVLTYARTGQLTPALAPAPEHWFDLVVVVDDAPSMAVWSEAIADLTRTFKHLDAFRTARTWTLTPDGNRPVLRDHLGKVARSEQLYAASERRLVIVISDCAAAGWRRPAVWQLLREWSTATTTALLNPLPTTLWRQIGLSQPTVRVGPGPRGTRNAGLRHKVPFLFQSHADDWIALPVITFSPHSMGRWAGTVMRGDPDGCDAVLVPTQGRLADAVIDAASPSAAERVETFRTVASPAAVRLAAFCAPYQQVGLPLLNLIRQELVPEASVGDLAEVLVGGLFTTTAGTDSRPVLHLRPGVRDWLQEILSERDAWRMYHVLSKHVAATAGLPAGLSAALYDPAGDVNLPLGLHPFAEATRETLRMLDALPRVIESAPDHDDGPAVSESIRPPEEVGTRPMPQIDGPRFPGEPPRVWRAPSRNSSFTGRDSILELLRDRLSASTALTGPAVLQGFGGVGKTQIAMEYLHRFTADYDILWWISADQPALVRTALAELATELELPVAGSVAEQVQAVLEALRRGEPSPRWIVVFDNADDPNQIREFVPTGMGDVIITTPSQEWAREAWTIDVNVFERTESVELLSRRVDTLSPNDADAIAEKLGDLPLAVEQAATWLATTAMTARSYLELLDEHLPRILNEPPPPGYPHPAANTWRLSQERLRESNPAAAYLLELFAFFAPEPIPTRLLNNPGMIDALVAFDPSLRDPLLHGSLIRDINRYGLARVDPAIPAIRIHRLVQNVVRSDLPEAIQTKRRTQVWAILANERRDDPDRQENWQVYATLRPHLEPTSSLDSDDPQVHALVIDMVRYLRARNDLLGSQELAQRTIDSWQPRLGADDRSVLRIRIELANTLHTLGRYAEGLAVLDEAIPRLAGTLGDTHPYTAMARRAVAGHLRGLGRYRDAYQLDVDMFSWWRATHGDDHDQTLRAANNLAISQRLVGNFQEALILDEDILRRRYKVTGPAQPVTLATATRYGRDLRDVGELERSLERLETTLNTAREVFGPDHRITLAAAKSLVVTWRRLGRLDEAHELITTVNHGYERTMDTRHPDALACALEVACVRSARGDHDGARQLAEDLLARYREISGDDHPFTLAAANDLAIFQMRADDYAAARPLIEDTTGRFVTVLGADHPYTLVCQMNLANANFAIGHITEAFRLDQHHHRRLAAKFKRDHPTVLAATINLAIALRATGAKHEAAAHLAEAMEASVRILGPTHPNTVAIHEGTRINIDIEPADV